MAKKSTTSTAAQHAAKPKKRRPGVHAKKKRGVHKDSKNWVKPYRGQGR